MSVAKSKILNCTHGFLAQADVGVNSPSQGNNQNVNVIVQPIEKGVNNDNPYPQMTPIYPPPIVERGAEPDIENTSNIEELITNKEKLIEALNIMLDIADNNPLIINKYKVAEEKTFIKLIELLTDADVVELVKLDAESSCNCKIKYEVVQKIIVKKNNNVYNLKYNFPDVIEELDNRKISYKLIC